MGKLNQNSSEMYNSYLLGKLIETQLTYIKIIE